MLYFLSIRDFILLLDHGASQSLHNTVLCDIKELSILRFVLLKVSALSLIFLLKNDFSQ